MTCFKPLKAYRSREVNASGKRGLVFNAQAGYVDLPVEVPCGQCIGCRIDRSKQWAVRCVHEASLHERNCFITLTYSDEHLPADNSLRVEDWQLFMKRLRAKHGKMRFFHCGEYGEQDERPHYHALLFGFDFPDKYVWKKSANAEHLLYRSPSLEALWPYGFSSIGAVTFQTAAYCARYILKKMTGEGALIYEPHMDDVTGQVYGARRPPYITMSRRPGLAQAWFEKFKSDVYPDDFVVLLEGPKARVPAYYDGKLPEAELKKIKRERKLSALSHADNNTPERRKVREAVLEARISKLKREL